MVHLLDVASWASTLRCSPHPKLFVHRTVRGIERPIRRGSWRASTSLLLSQEIAMASHVPAGPSPEREGSERGGANPARGAATSPGIEYRMPYARCRMQIARPLYSLRARLAPCLCPQQCSLVHSQTRLRNTFHLRPCSCSCLPNRRSTKGAVTTGECAIVRPKLRLSSGLLLMFNLAFMPV